MPEPIDPQDHTFQMTLGGRRGTAGEFLAVDESMWTPQIAALIEAVHQTFERDARNPRPGDTAPDTEIDRQARLIVDAEYRRRAKEVTDA